MKALESNFFYIEVKSKSRVQDFGEVFTPKKVVNEMLDMFDQSIWSNENQIFFEPTCGHGNFVVSILERRLEALYKKAKRTKIKKPEFYAVANAINTLWAIDIDQENINETRFRTLKTVLRFLISKENKKAITLINLNQKFFTHILCAIDHQIYQNDLITALEKDKKLAKKKSLKTKASKKWLRSGKHKPIDFDYTWVEFLKKNKLNIQFKRKEKFIKKLINQAQEIKFSGELEKQYFIQEENYGS